MSGVRDIGRREGAMCSNWLLVRVTCSHGVLGLVLNSNLCDMCAPYAGYQKDLIRSTVRTSTNTHPPG